MLCGGHRDKRSLCPDRTHLESGGLSTGAESGARTREIEVMRVEFANNSSHYHLWAAVLFSVIVPLIFLAGCIATKVQVRLDEDGSGSRRVEMVWKQGALDDLELSEEDVRELLDLPSDRGWVSRHENRPVEDGSLEPHVVFERETRMASIDDWRLKGPDLRMRASVDHAERLGDETFVEVGRGSGYRTVSYYERLDGREIREPLDRMAAQHIVEKLGPSGTALGETQLAEMRGILLGHLRHYDVWAVEDEDADKAWAALARDVAPQLAYIIAGRSPSPGETDRVIRMVDEILENEEIRVWLDEELPGLSLLALMNLKIEVVMPGTIVESNADRIGSGFAAWEGPVWAAINDPLEFRVRTRIED